MIRSIKVMIIKKCTFFLDEHRIESIYNNYSEIKKTYSEIKKTVDELLKFKLNSGDMLKNIITKAEVERRNI